MKILHVITALQKAAGTTTFVENVVGGLRALGHDVDVALSVDKFMACDVMHIHGIWSGLLHKAAGYANANNIPIVWSTHGMTAPWSMKHKWWKKLPAWLLYQKSDLQGASVIHCTTEQEVEWNKKFGFKKCIVVPLGTEIKPLNLLNVTGKSHCLLFVGRIYPVKGLKQLISAWGKVVRDLEADMRRERWKLRIVGPDQAGHRSELEAMVVGLQLEEFVELVGPKYDVELEKEYDNCDCLVLPSFTENFGGVIVDALAHGKPCIASTFTPWCELRERECGWWVSNEPEVLASAIYEMITLDDVRRHEMGMRGRKLVAEKYTWDAVVKAMVRGYEEVLDGRA